ncbi:hypothetical protein AB0L71_04725 [Streptomyces sp. NPDC052052]|uniref:hypothetical protein n=1 Tax=Streptomyces sp. NPDC052052 TaxID=3154756 RepID=UPI00341C9D5D
MNQWGPAAQQWRNLVGRELSFYKSPFSERIREEGRAEGRVDGFLYAILAAFELRGIDVPDEVRERIARCGDALIMYLWLSRALTAVAAADIFVEE